MNRSSNGEFKQDGRRCTSVVLMSVEVSVGTSSLISNCAALISNCAASAFHVERPQWRRFKQAEGRVDDKAAFFLVRPIIFSSYSAVRVFVL
jgi:hypothetical protein